MNMYKITKKEHGGQARQKKRVKEENIRCFFQFWLDESNGNPKCGDENDDRTQHS